MDSANRARRSTGEVVRMITDAVRRGLHWPRAYRFTFTFDEEGVRLVRRTPRLQPAPPSDDLARAPMPHVIVAELRRRSYLALLICDVQGDG